MKRILTDLYFEGVSRLRRALLGTEAPLVNSEIGYDNVHKRVRVHDGTSAKKLLQENDISTDVALGTSDTLLPSQNAVKKYVDAFAGANGQDGKSAYQIWLDNGNVGTEQEFLDSLVGANGLDGTNGINGANGSNGLDGKSAYEIWLNNGNIGSESVFLDSLVGADGLDGMNGIDGQDGSNGIDGKDGKSAYQVWLDNGNIGTIQDFLDSLVGADGSNGIDGTNGLDGQDGKSAHQVWLDNGGVGTEQDFLNSLVGQDGSNGTNGIDGTNGTNGIGVPIGGTAGQILFKIDGTDYNTQWKTEFSITETALATIQNPATTESDKYVSARRFWSGITTFLGLSNIWTALQTFTSIATKQIYTTKQTFTVVGANPTQVINLDNGSYISLNLTSASGTLTLSLTNGKIGASYWIQVVQATTKVDVILANEGRFDGESGNTIVGENSKNYCIIPLFTGTGYLLNIATLT